MHGFTRFKCISIYIYVCIYIYIYIYVYIWKGKRYVYSCWTIWNGLSARIGTHCEPNVNLKIKKMYWHKPLAYITFKLLHIPCSCRKQGLLKGNVQTVQASLLWCFSSEPTCLTKLPRRKPFWLRNWQIKEPRASRGSLPLQRSASSMLIDFISDTVLFICIFILICYLYIWYFFVYIAVLPFLYI